MTPDGQRILVMGGGNTIRIIEIASGREVTSVHFGNPRSAVFSPDGRSFAAVRGVPYKAQVWDAQTGQAITPLLDPKSQIVRASFSPDGRLLALHGAHAAFVWDVRTGQQLLPPLHHEMWVKDASFSPDGRYLATASLDQTARVWDLESGQAVTGPLRHSGFVQRAFFAGDGGRLITRSDDGTVRLWHLSARRSARPMLPHEQPVDAVQFSPDGRTMLTASGRTMQLWNIQTGQPAAAPMRHEMAIVTAVVSPTGERAIVICADSGKNQHKAYLWDIPSRKCKELPLEWKLPSIPKPSFSRDGRQVLLFDDSGAFKLWNAISGELSARIAYSANNKPFGRDNRIYRLAALSPDGDRIVSDAPTVANTLSRGAMIWDRGAQEPWKLAAQDIFLHAVDSYRTIVEGEQKAQGRPPSPPNQPRQLLAVTPNSDNLAWSLSHLGILYRDGGRLKEAETALANAADIRRFAVLQDSKNLNNHALFAWTQTHAAQTALLQKDHVKARRLVVEAERHIRTALAAAPANADFRGNLAFNRRIAMNILNALGDHESVPKCVSDFLEMSGNTAGATYDSACYLSLCAALVEKDDKLSESKRKEMGQQYAERAVAYLRQAIDKGWRNVEWMKQDKDLDPIRERADFQQCVADLNKKLAPKK